MKMANHEEIHRRDNHLIEWKRETNKDRQIEIDGKKAMRLTISFRDLQTHTQAQARSRIKQINPNGTAFELNRTECKRI